MLFYLYNIICYLYILYIEFIANNRCLYNLLLASIYSCFLPVFQIYKTYFSWFYRPKMIEFILDFVIACIRKYLVAKFKYNIQANI